MINKLQKTVPAKGIMFIAFFIACSIHASAQLMQTAKSTAGGRGYLEYLPPDYATNPTRTYPLIIFLHGAGEVGNGSSTDLEKLKVAGPPKEINNGKNMCFNVNGVDECFIVISPQLNSGPGGWWPSILEPFFNDILNNSNYRIDRTRVYLTGLSLGGQGVYIGLGQTTDSFAAGAVIAGFDNGNGCAISSRQIAVWGFHGTSDGTINYNTGLANFNNIVNCTSPAPTAELKWTSYSGVGHNSWDRAFSTDHSYQTPVNLYEWLLSKSKGVAGNINPVVSGGINKIIVLPVNSTTLTGTATDSDGTIAAQQWTQVSGPNTATLSNASTATVSLSNLIAGVYTMKLTAMDNAGGIGSGTVTVTVSAAPTNANPVVSAGTNKSIVLPVNSTTLTGTATDSDGTIASYQWTQMSGPNTATLGNVSTVTVSLSNLIAGVYTMKLTATDNAGGIGSATATITVSPAPGSGTNLALLKPVTTSSTEAWLGTASVGSNAVDGVANTRWSSAVGDPQWLQIDLGVIYSINRVQITWETACASNYEVQVSNDATNWVSIKTVTGNSVLLNNHLNLSGSGRYIRMYGTARFTAYGYSIYEIEVYGALPNALPIVNAGADQLVQLPTSTLSIAGTATDNDGTIASYAWTKISGPAATLTNAATSTLSLSGLVAGSYVFRLAAADNLGGSAYDDVNVIVNAAPVVNAGTDQVLQLPTSTLSITGVATDNDGTIASYAWTKTSGPAATLTNTATATLSISGLVAGSYVFRLTVADNLGGSGYDEVTVTVTPASSPTTNIALQKPVTTSSTEAWLGTQSVGTNAVDGIANTRWASAQVENQWIAVDLGATYSISKIKIIWEAAYGANYTIDYSLDGDSWSTVKTVTGNQVLTNEHTTGISGSTRFVRINGTLRGTAWGYSIYELEVYGDLNSNLSNLSAARSASVTSDITSSPAVAAEQEVSLDFLDKKYSGGKEYEVVIFNSSGNRIYYGNWSQEVHERILKPDSFYFYTIVKDGKRIDSGKVITK